MKRHLIGKVAAIVAYCDLREIEYAADVSCIEYLHKIKELAVDGAEMALTCDSQRSVATMSERLPVM